MQSDPRSRIWQSPTRPDSDPPDKEFELTKTPWSIHSQIRMIAAQVDAEALGFESQIPDACAAECRGADAGRTTDSEDRPALRSEVRWVALHSGGGGGVL